MSEPWEPKIVIHDLGTAFPLAPAKPPNLRTRLAQGARRLAKLAPKFWGSFRFLVLGLLPVALTMLLVISVVVEIYSDRVEIASIAMPDDLQKQGYTPETVARQLFDEMSAI